MHDILVQSYKYDGTEHRRWIARLQKQEDSLLVLEGRFAEEVRHEFLGTLPSGMVSIEYYWLDRWYNVFRFEETNGELRSYYCNVNVPPIFDGCSLKYVDLDIDILVQPDLSYNILDLDEFRHNAAYYCYSEEIKH